jgi:hypothetical protein
MSTTQIIPTELLPEKVKNFVAARFGKWAGRVLSETSDPHFLNPLIGVDENGEVVYNRLREYWNNGCSTSVSRPEPGSLTEVYASNGYIILVKGHFIFKTTARHLDKNLCPRSILSLFRGSKPDLDQQRKETLCPASS